MIRHDYTQEVGLKPATKKVPLPVALLILAAAAGLVWWGAVNVPSFAVVHGSPAAEAQAATAPQK